MNLTTLAELAGVSVSTVSKAFAGSGEISEKTKQRIFALAKEHDCYDQYNKNKFSKKVIAVIVPELKSNYYTTIVTLLYEEITSMGGVMIASSCEFSEERKAELFHYFASYCKADGIIVIGSCSKLKNSFHIPAVAVFSDGKNPNIDVIHNDMSVAIKRAVSYLKELGHTEIGFAGETLTTSKLQLFKGAMRKCALPVRREWIKTSPLRFEEAGIRMAEEWIREGNLPTAILAAYDNIAIGILKTLRQHGYRVPDQVSVIGMDDISVASYLDTPLSSIGTHTRDACQCAVELIMKKLENQYYSAPGTVNFPAEFIPRDSSGPCPSR